MIIPKRAQLKFSKIKSTTRIFRNLKGEMEFLLDTFGCMATAAAFRARDNG